MTRSTPEPPGLRGGLFVRSAVLVAGLFVFAGGIVALVKADLGLSPWDVLHQGIARQTPLSLGQAIVVLSVVIVGISWRLGGPIGVGTAVNATLVGVFVDLQQSLEPIADLGHQPLPTRFVLVGGGVVGMAFGSALYIGAGFGAGPRDSLMVAGASKTRFRIGVVRGSIEVAALALGVVLGGTVGIGTLIFAVAIGPTIELAFWSVQQSPFTLPALKGDPHANNTQD